MTYIFTIIAFIFMGLYLIASIFSLNAKDTETANTFNDISTVFLTLAWIVTMCNIIYLITLEE